MTSVSHDWGGDMEEGLRLSRFETTKMFVLAFHSNGCWVDRQDCA